MKRSTIKGNNGCGIALLVAVLIFIAAGVFLILGGMSMFLIEKNGLAWACIAIGVVDLMFFGSGLILMSNPQNKIAKFLMFAPAVLIIVGIFVFVFGSMIYSLAWQPVADMEHYLQVYKNPAIVKAIVTDHESYDDEGDTDYRSYVTYVYDNVRYNDFPYEDKNEKEDLTPLGEEVTLEISPKDPRQQISKLKSGAPMILIIVLMLSIGLAGIYMLLQRFRLSKKNGGTPDTETIHKDMKVMIAGRFMRPFLMICFVVYGIIYWRYSVAFGIFPLIIAAVCGVLWIYFMYITLRDLRRVENGEFELRRSELVDKKETTDSEGYSTYTLYYESNGQKWHTNTKYSDYKRAQIGDVVTAVFLPGKKKPIVYYGRNGRGV